METVVYNFHDSKCNVFKNFKLKAGDDATHVTWMDIDSELKLYATHKDFIEKVASKHKAHWKSIDKDSNNNNNNNKSTAGKKK